MELPHWQSGRGDTGMEQTQLVVCIVACLKSPAARLWQDLPRTAPEPTVATTTLATPDRECPTEHLSSDLLHLPQHAGKRGTTSLFLGKYPGNSPW